MGAKERDNEMTYSVSEFASVLRGLADGLESGKPFDVEVAGERIFVPTLRAAFKVEHERDSAEEEIEFQIKWVNE